MATTKSPKAKPATAKSKSTETPKATVRKKRAPGKASTKLTASFNLEQKPSAVEPEIPHDAIAMRAYFIAERRHKMGWHGDSHTDWQQAEAQLKAEALEKPMKKR